MFHLAQRCPHCGAAAPAREASKEGAVSVEEARALLQATTPPRPERFADLAADFVLPRGGAVELVTSVVAAPLTVFTVLATGYVLLRQRAETREARLAGARVLAVPVCAGLAALIIWSETNADAWTFGVLGVAFVAWVIRTVLRASARSDSR